MNNTLQRLLLFFVGIPGFIALVVYIPFARYLPVILIAFAVIAISTREMLAMLSASGTSLEPKRSILANLSIAGSGYLACLATTAGYNRILPAEVILFATGCAAVCLLSPAAFAIREELPHVMRKTAGAGLLLVYPGLLGAFWILIVSGFDLGMEAIFTFTLLTFGNDSLAWFFGMTLGRKRGIVAASPNKSIAGFAGGLAGSMVAAFFSKLLFPAALSASWLVIAILGLVTGVSVITGDLFESALKRSAGVKDSGTFVPGRGGLLDSFDSLLFAAPGFVLISRLAGFFSQIQP